LTGEKGPVFSVVCKWPEKRIFYFLKQINAEAYSIYIYITANSTYLPISSNN